jgi:hypothetical protein
MNFFRTRVARSNSATRFNRKSLAAASGKVPQATRDELMAPRSNEFYAREEPPMKKNSLQVLDSTLYFRLRFDRNSKP